MTGDTRPGQQPTQPAPDTAPDENGQSSPIPKNVWLRRLRVWMRFIRLKLAKAILLPELNN